MEPKVAALTAKRAEEGQMFYAIRTGGIGTKEAGDDITIIGPGRIAEMVPSAGLLDWVTRRRS
jgi:hypothetical protein